MFTIEEDLIPELSQQLSEFANPEQKMFQENAKQFVAELITALNEGRPIYFIFDKDGLMVDSEVIGKLAWIESLKEFGVDLGLEQLTTEDILNASNESGWTKGLQKIGVPKDVIKLSEFVGKRADAVDDQIMKDFGERIRKTEKYLSYDVETAAERDSRAIAEIRALKEHHLNGYLESGIPVKPGLLKLLRLISYLKDNEEIRSEIKTAIATSDSKGPSVSQLESLGAYQMFDAGVFKGDYKGSKPAPDAFLEAEDRLSEGNSNKNPFCITLEDSPAGVEGGAAAGHWTVAIPDMVELDEFRLPVKALERIITVKSLSDLAKILWGVVESGNIAISALDDFSDEVTHKGGPVVGSDAT